MMTEKQTGGEYQRRERQRVNIQVSVGDVVQLDGSDQRFAYCFLTVTEVLTTDVLGYVMSAEDGASSKAYYRAKKEHVTRIGPAEWLDPADDD
jgi:hypothetical protein